MTKERLPHRSKAMITLVLSDDSHTINLATKTNEVWYDMIGDKVYADIESMWELVKEEHPQFQSDMPYDEKYHLVGALGIIGTGSHRGHQPHIVWVTQAQHPKTMRENIEQVWETD